MKPNPLSFDTFLYVFKRWLFIVFLAFSIIVAFLLPDTIPTHFNENGEVDAYGNKSNFLILPIIGIFIYLLISVLIKYPALLFKLNKKNQEKGNTKTIRLFNILQISVLITFSVLIISIYLITKKSIFKIGSWFLPFTIVILCFPTVFYLMDYLNDKKL